MPPERHILVTAELLAHLVDIHGLVIDIDILISECLLRDEIHDIAILINADHRAVHPVLIFVHKCKVRLRAGNEHIQNLLVEIKSDSMRIVSSLQSSSFANASEYILFVLSYMGLSIYSIFRTSSYRCPI